MDPAITLDLRVSGVIASHLFWNLGRRILYQYNAPNTMLKYDFCECAVFTLHSMPLQRVHFRSHGPFVLDNITSQSRMSLNFRTLVPTQDHRPFTSCCEFTDDGLLLLRSSRPMLGVVVSSRAKKIPRESCLVTNWWTGPFVLSLRGACEYL